MRHLLSIEKLAPEDMRQILADSVVLKKERDRGANRKLAGQIWAILFAKSSTRTRISFEASTSRPSCSSFFAIERSIELKAAGRLSVIVAIGPSIRSSAGSSGRETTA